MGKYDTALLRLKLTTGIRTQEASLLVESDLRQTFGPVFWGFYKGNNKVRKSALSTRAIQGIVSSYAISSRGHLVIFTPHGLRISYVRILFLASMDPGVIKQNMGHESVQATFDYIGTIDASDRQPPNAVFFDVASYLREAPPTLSFPGKFASSPPLPNSDCGK